MKNKKKNSLTNNFEIVFMECVPKATATSFLNENPYNEEEMKSSW